MPGMGWLLFQGPLLRRLLSLVTEGNERQVTHALADSLGIKHGRLFDWKVKSDFLQP